MNTSMNVNRSEIPTVVFGDGWVVGGGWDKGRGRGRLNRDIFDHIN